MGAGRRDRGSQALLLLPLLLGRLPVEAHEMQTLLPRHRRASDEDDDDDVFYDAEEDIFYDARGGDECTPPPPRVLVRRVQMATAHPDDDDPAPQPLRLDRLGAWSLRDVDGPFAFLVDGPWAAPMPTPLPLVTLSPSPLAEEREEEAEAVPARLRVGSWVGESFVRC